MPVASCATTLSTQNSTENFDRADGTSIVFVAPDEAPLAILPSPMIVVIAKRAKGHMLTRPYPKMHVTDIAMALCVIAIDMDNQISQQMLCHTACIKIAPDTADNRGTSLERPFSELGDSIITQNARKTHPVPIVHEPCELGQARLNLVMYNYIVDIHMFTLSGLEIMSCVVRI
jgi:uncharacterized protein (UPF0261 family)